VCLVCVADMAVAEFDPEARLVITLVRLVVVFVGCRRIACHCISAVCWLGIHYHIADHDVLCIDEAGCWQMLEDAVDFSDLWESVSYIQMKPISEMPLSRCLL
jgi:hypothetical protein